MSDCQLVSLVIPVYNVQPFLQRCLDSVVNQTYSNIEILLVDDGSTDESGKMCDDFALLHSNVVVVHQNNQGLSSARNNGVEIAKGELVAFVDSDDMVPSNSISYLVGLLNEFSADIAVGKAYVSHNGQVCLKNQTPENRFVMSRQEALREMLYGYKFGVSAPAKLYKIELLKQHLFPVGELYEDLSTTYKIFMDAKIVAYGSNYVYCYYKNFGSITRSAVSDSHLNAIKIAYEIIDYFSINLPEIVPAAKVRCIKKISEFLPMITENTKRNRYLFAFLKDSLHPIEYSVLLDKSCDIKTKLKIILMHCGFSITRIVCRIDNYKKELMN